MRTRMTSRQGQGRGRGRDSEGEREYLRAFLVSCPFTREGQSRFRHDAEQRQVGRASKQRRDKGALRRDAPSLTVATRRRGGAGGDQRLYERARGARLTRPTSTAVPRSVPAERRIQAPRNFSTNSILYALKSLDEEFSHHVGRVTACAGTLSALLVRGRTRACIHTVHVHMCAPLESVQHKRSSRTDQGARSRSESGRSELRASERMEEERRDGWGG